MKTFEAREDIPSPNAELTSGNRKPSLCGNSFRKTSPTTGKRPLALAPLPLTPQHYKTQQYKPYLEMKIEFTVASCDKQRCVIKVKVGQPINDKIEMVEAGQLTMPPNKWLLFSTAQIIAQKNMTSPSFKHYECVLNDEVYEQFQQQYEDQ